ncbi:potassium channel family protein [Archaeoglobus veneficus]|uniref:TrkA-N domain protein n=1 Tax=Archaeoglobus veneficus (strain DSM 11195 / SNP6) TaxID=693661 RepID=F2KPL4_ARCVS|nr:potassium channel protein [Archaeoglobus veneficus]AEA47542.1 TrkA-N domain protein [Archaeoglobus veneficus SNP6]
MNYNNLERRIVILILLLIAVTTFGTLGYYFIEGWPLFDCLYMTVLTITTTGYREVGELSAAGRVLSMFLMVFGVGLFLYSIDAVIPVLIERRSERWKKLLEKISNHVIVCGYGKMGMEISKEFSKDKVVVIDLDPNKVTIARENGFLAVQGDATEEEVLEKAGVRRARCLVVCMERDSANAFAVMVAKDMNPEIFTISVLRTPASEKKLRRVGVDMLLSPYRDAAKKVAVAVQRPTAADFIEIIGRQGTLMLEKIVLRNNEFAGKSLRDTNLRKLTGCIVVAIERNGEVIFPDPDTVLKLEDVLYVLGKEGNLGKLEKLVAKASQSSR